MTALSEQVCPQSRSLIEKFSIYIHGCKSSVSLEKVFWLEAKKIAIDRGLGISKLVEEIDDKRTHANLSSAIRLFVLEHHKAAAQVVTQARIVQ